MSNDDPLHTLEILATKVGAAQPGLLDAFIAGTNNEQLTAKGREIATNRLVTDGVRLYQEAYAFWSNASNVQKESLKGFSLPLLTIAVHHLVALHQRQQSIIGSAATDNQSKARRSGDAEVTAANALALRDQAFSALRDAAGLDEGLRAEVAEAVGTAEDVSSLALGLDQLASVLNGWLSFPADSPLQARLALGNLNAPYAQQLAATAGAVRTTAAQAGERVEAKAAAQAGLDREDGIAILLLGQIVRAFEAAHDLDPTVPRLLPNSTRRLFSRRVKKTTSPPTPTNP
jgi:hypothetical protein